MEQYYFFVKRSQSVKEKFISLRMFERERKSRAFIGASV